MSLTSPLLLSGPFSKPFLLRVGLCLALIGALVTSASAEPLAGRITDSATGASLGGAKITLTPAGGGDDLVALSDAFGYYRLDDVPTGSHSVTASRGGYVPETDPAVVVSAGLLTPRDFALDPLFPGTATFDIYAQVNDTKTGMALSGVPVRLQRYGADAGDPLEETFTELTNEDGLVEFRGLRTGRFTFRFNDSDDGAPKLGWGSLNRPTPVLLDKHHSAIAQLLPDANTLTIHIEGPDPTDPEAGIGPLEGVLVELTGFDDTVPLPIGFIPFLDDLAEEAVMLLPPRTGVTDASGDVVFTDLPTIPYLVKPKKLGYVLPPEAPPTPAVFPESGSLPASEPYVMDLDPAGTMDIFLINDEYDTTSPPDSPIGMLEVKVQGIEGTHTEGIERITLSSPLPPSGEFPMGASLAEIPALLPGRYRVSVDSHHVTSPFLVADYALSTIDLRFRGERLVELAQGVPGDVVLPVKVVPARIRGRFYVAEEADTLGALRDTHPDAHHLWEGPIYQRTAQAGIEFTESDTAGLLMPGSEVIALDASDDGTFTATVRPSSYGVAIPSMDGYWGSNYSSHNTTTGERFELGWPYPVTPSIPIPPFGSLGVPLSSGDELEMDLYVRKQLFYLEGSVPAGGIPPTNDLVLARSDDGSTLVTTAFSDLALRGSGSMTLDGGGTAPFSLLTGAFSSSGAFSPTNALRFRSTVPPGTHSLSLMHPVYTAGFSAPPAPPGPTGSITLPHYGHPGEAVGDIPALPLHRSVDPFLLPPPILAELIYDGETELEAEFYGRTFVDEVATPVLRYTRSIPAFVQAPDLGDRLFAIPSGGPFRMAEGSWTVWFEADGDWYKGSVYADGGPGTVTVSFFLHDEWETSEAAGDRPPERSYKLRVRAVSEADPTFQIPGIGVDFDPVDPSGELTTPATGWAELPGWTGDSVPISTEDGKWLPASGTPGAPTSFTIEIDPDPADPVISVTLRMKRGMAVKGRLTDLDFPARGIPGAEVVVRNRHGVRLAEAVTVAGSEGPDPEGYFELGSPLPNAEVIFLDVAARGYRPKRVRVAPNNDGPDGTPVDINLTAEPDRIKLVQLPTPSFLSTLESFDRRGPFLPGIRKSASAGPLVDDDDVIMDYDVRVRPATFPLDLKPFDTAAGAESPDPVPPPMLTDRVKYVWIVDPRSFATDPFKDDAVPSPPPVLGDALFNEEMAAWLEEIRSKPNLFYRRISMLGDASGEPSGEPGDIAATGSIDLASLPPGGFLPVVVAETEHGAYNYFTLEHTGDDAHKNLFGLTLPAWLNQFADHLGTISAIQNGGVSLQMKNIVPADLIVPRPSVTGDITVSPEGFLTYTYGLGVNVREGGDVPAAGLLKFGSGFAGVAIDGVVTLEIDGAGTDTEAGEVASISFSGEVSANQTADLDLAAYVPKSVPPRVAKKIGEAIKNDVKAKVVAGGSAKIKTLESLQPPTPMRGTLKPLERSVEMTTAAGISAPIEVNLTSVAEKAPYVGPVFVFLNRSKAARLKGLVTPSAGAAVTRKLTTRFPRLEPASGDDTTATYETKDYTDDKPLTQRRTFFGEELVPFEVNFDTKRALCLGFTTGLRFEVFSNRIGAQGTLNVTGNECRLPVAPGGGSIGALEIEMNRFADWPPIKRITGDLTGEVKGYLDAYLVKVEKKWTWPLLHIDRPFNTEAVFLLVEMDVEETTYSVATAPSATWLGTSPQLIRGMFTNAQFELAAAGSGDDALLVYMDPDGGSLKLRGALRTSGSWAAPVDIVTTTGMTAATVHPLDGGGWMVVWAEIAPADASKVNPPVTLKSTTSTDGLTWTAPVTIGSLPGAALEMKLLPMPGGDLGLITVSSDPTAGAEVVDLTGFEYSAATWSGPTTVFDGAILASWDAAGPGFTGSEPAQVALLGTDGLLYTTTWDGTASPAPALFTPEPLGGTVRLAAGPADTFWLASALEGSGIGLWTKPAAGSWAALSTPFPGEIADDLALGVTDDTSSSKLSLSWIGGGTDSSLRTAYLDTAGTVTTSDALTLNGALGQYESLSWQSHAGAHAGSLFALHRHTDGEVELRVFEPVSDGSPFTGDRDTDTLPDLDELRIVDHDPADAIDTIDHVLAGDDFDGDGSLNGAEITAGTDPTDPLSYPGQLVEVEATEPDCFEFGTLPGTFFISRAGDASTALTVHYAIGGSATNGTDYSMLAGSVEIPEGLYGVTVFVQPLADTEAEGMETVSLTLTTDAAYSIGAASSDTIAIADLPMDDWRFSKFTSGELADDGISGEEADPEFDGLVNILEYAFGREPKLNDSSAPTSTVLLTDGSSDYLALVYVRETGSSDLLFEPQVSSDMDDWSSGASHTETVSVTDNGDGTETVVERDLTPTSANTRRFMRLDVQRIP